MNIKKIQSNSNVLCSWPKKNRNEGMSMWALSSLHALSCLVPTKTPQWRYQQLYFKDWEDNQLVGGGTAGESRTAVPASVWQGLWARHRYPPNQPHLLLSALGRGALLMWPHPSPHPSPQPIAGCHCHWEASRLVQGSSRQSPWGQWLHTAPGNDLCTGCTDYRTLYNKDSDSF